MGAPAPRPGYAQLGAIVEAPGRNVFIRLVGPEATVDANRAAFEAMLDGMTVAETPAG
jgi:ribulose 1,5-bisphosphate carboxylase large subunit-like protein